MADVLLKRLARDVFDFCYPPRCAACDGPCDEGGEGGEPPSSGATGARFPAHFLCPGCDAALRRLEASAACGCCGLPLAEPEAPCPYCSGKGRPPYQRILRLGPFRDPLKHLVHRLKYNGRWSLAERLAERLAARRDVRDLLAESDCLLPVPLHRLRQTGRGYNQAELIARALACHARRVGCGRPKVVRPVVRLRRTETQTHLHSIRSRVRNLQDAFGLLDDRLVRGRRVLVVDDVLTTGATLRALARALRPAGPASLSAVVLAAADARGQGLIEAEA